MSINKQYSCNVPPVKLKGTLVKKGCKGAYFLCSNYSLFVYYMSGHKQQLVKNVRHIRISCLYIRQELACKQPARPYHHVRCT